MHLEGSPERGIFSNRTLNLRSIRAIGYDMDYTLIHYKVNLWEKIAYDQLKQRLLNLGWSVENLEFIPDFMIRGLVIDKELGNIVKPNRFGYVKIAYHGTKPIPFEQQRKLYLRTLVDSREERWAMMTTLFNLSEACMFSQLVDLLDDGKLGLSLRYSDLYQAVRNNLDAAYAEGLLKGKVLDDPSILVEFDPDTTLTLLDQKYAGKKLLLITNSEWTYANRIMDIVFTPNLPGDMTWRDLFDLIIVSSRKPAFFTGRHPAFEIVDEQGLLRPVVGPLKSNKIYLGGDAGKVEKALGLSGEEILYVGDHVESDVYVSKSLRRWRTALVVRELENELAELNRFSVKQAELSRLMNEKEQLEFQSIQLSLKIQRVEVNYGPVPDLDVAEAKRKLQELRTSITEIDEKIKPLAIKARQSFNYHWGNLTRAGYDIKPFRKAIGRGMPISTCPGCPIS